MTRVRVVVRSALATALLTLLASGCGTATEVPPPSGASGSASGTALLQVEVTEVRASAAGLALVLQVPAGGDGCATRPRARVDAREAGNLHLTTVVDSDQADDCTRTELRTVASRVLLRGDQLVVNGEAWEPTAGGVFVRCSELVGCDPPADSCDPAWTGLVTHGAELPPEQQVDVVACSARGLVVDVDAVPTGCQPVDGSTPPAGCVGASTHVRWFAVPGGGRRWTVVASGTAAGCADVLAAAPHAGFPRALCRDLPPR